MKPLQVVAAFDIGSNSIKMTVAQRDDEGAIREITSQAQTTRLGAGIETTGRLSDESIAASLDTLRQFIAMARSFGASLLVGVATEATRIAANGPQFMSTILDELGLDIATISGDEEAELTFQGLPESLRGSGSILAADIGGASTELIEAVEGVRGQSISYPIGSGRLTDRFVPTDPPSASELDSVRQFTAETVQAEGWPANVDKLIILGGTGEYMQMLMSHDWPAVTGELPQILAKLTTVLSSDLARTINASEMRARVLPAGIAIVAGLANVCGPETIYGSPSGIRLGLIRQAFGVLDT